MAGQEPAKRNNEVTDPTLAANVNKERSYSQRAVDARLDVAAAPAVAGALANDPTVRNQIRQIAEGVIDTGTLTAANIDEDTDGTPYYSPGSTTFNMIFDLDGTPVIVPA